MGNCLVTKLKSVVDNNSLLKLGEIRFYINSATDMTAAIYTLAINGGKTWNLKSLDGAKIIKSDGTVVEEIQSIEEVTNIGFKAGSYEVSLSNKYEISIFDSVADRMYISTDCFEFSNQIWYLRARNMEGTLSKLSKLQNLRNLAVITDNESRKLTGKISDLANLPRIESLRCGGSHLTGDISDLFSYVNLTNLTFVELTYQKHITGDLTEFVSGLRSHIGSSGRFSIGLYGTLVSIGGHRVDQDTSVHNLDWTANTYIYKLGSDSDVEDVSKNVVIYTYGYTAEQIQSLRNKGNTVYDVSAQ